MSKTKELYIEAKKSRNFQTYTSGVTILLEDGDNEDEIRAAVQAKMRKAVMEQINLDSVK